MDERYIEIIKRTAILTDNAFVEGLRTGANPEEITDQIFNSVAEIPEFPEIEESTHMVLQILNVYLLASARARLAAYESPRQVDPEALADQIEALRNFDARDVPPTA